MSQTQRPRSPAAEILDKLLARAKETGAPEDIKAVVAALNAEIGKYSLSDYRRGAVIPKADNASRIHRITKKLRPYGLNVKAYRWEVAA